MDLGVLPPPGGMLRTLTPKKYNMAKEITGYVKLQVKGGQANPAPPIGPALGSKGINIMEFCKQFNARTQDKIGKVSWAQVEAIATDKMPDLNCFTVESAMRMVAGTARSMGLTVEGQAPW